MSEGKEKSEINGATLKWLAMIFMLVDHIGAALVEPVLLYGVANQWITSEAMYKLWYGCYLFLRGLGRFSFPTYCFLLVEGITFTRSKVKYLRNLLCLAVLSEIPFDLVLDGTVFSLEHQNVYWTLAFGVIAVCIYHDLWYPFIQNNNIIKTLLMVLCVAAAEAAHTDYGAIGVLVILVMYTYRKKGRTEQGAMFSWLLLTAMNWLEVFCFPFILAVRRYNGERGRQNKYFFYLFYPLHLILLVGVRYALGM